MAPVAVLPLLQSLLWPTPKDRSFDGDFQGLFTISILLQHNFSRQDLFIGGDDSLFTDDQIVALGCLSLLWTDQHLGILQINGVDQKRIFIHLHLLKTQPAFIDGRLDLPMENITIIGSMRIRIMPSTISFPFQLIQRGYSMRHLNAASFMQFIKNLITLGYIKSKLNLLLPIFVNQLEKVTRIRFSLGRPTKFSSINIIRLIARTIGITFNIINIVTSMLKAIFGFFTPAFLGQSSLLQLRNCKKSMTI
jgi:hypothetical protein